MKTLEVKEKIMDVATHLFHTQGYNLTGINQVIDEAGIARGSLYNHFPSKTDLLLAYLERFQENWYRSFEIFAASIKDPKQKILALFDFRISNQQKNGFTGCPFIKINDEAGTTDERILKTIQDNKDKLKKYIGNIVNAIQYDGQALNTAELTQMIYLLLEGGITSASIYKDAKELKSAKNIVRKLL